MTPSEPMPMTRRTHLTTMGLHELDEACRPIIVAFRATPYLVGSAMEGKDWRDVDVRLMLLDEEFDRLFRGRPELWGFLCRVTSTYLRDRTGLPVDFQIQRASEASDKYGPRNSLGVRTVRDFAGGGDATRFVEVLPAMTPSTITVEQEAAIREYLNDRDIPAGLGTEEAACSVAAINLALTGKLTDDIPECMSEVIGRWIIGVQDAMPGEIRNSPEWRDLLPLAAGTGRELESERAALILDWMWGTALPLVQPLADARGYGREWRAMCEQRTEEAAWAASEAAWAAEAALAAWAASEAAKAAAASAAWAAARAAAWAAARAAAKTAARAAKSMGMTVPDAWATLDPCGLLQRLIALEVQP